MTSRILVLNGGSSSLKFAVYEGRSEPDLLLKGSVANLASHPRLKAQAEGQIVHERDFAAPLSLTEAGEAVFGLLEEQDLAAGIEVVGHRIVHGGQRFVAPARLDAAALEYLRRLVPLAPLHQPFNLDLVEMAAGKLPNTVQVGCFDTAFHANRPHVDRLYGLPRQLSADGILAYGFHGLSYAHTARVLKERDGMRAGGRVIVAHLGSGASLCAMAAGQSVATTMGFSALDGLVMGTRCGSIDPGVILHLLTDRGMQPDQVTALLYQRAGLLGVSGLSGDMATLLASSEPAAAQAVDLFIYRLGRAIGSLTAALGGLDTLVFTAGIGENAPLIRARTGEAAKWLGVVIDSERNTRGETLISASGSRVEVLVIPADEERAVAEGAIACLEKGERSQHGG